MNSEPPRARLRLILEVSGPACGTPSSCAAGTVSRGFAQRAFRPIDGDPHRGGHLSQSDGAGRRVFDAGSQRLHLGDADSVPVPTSGMVALSRLGSEVTRSADANTL